MINVLVMFGGVSCEHDVSIITAMQCINNLDKNKYNVIPIYVSKSGDFLYSKKYLDLKNFSKGKIKGCKVCFMPNSNVLYKKSALGFKKFKTAHVALLCFHGINGEDGTIASLLKLSGIPQTTGNQLANALAMDKCVFKTYLKGLGIKCAKSVSVTSHEFYKNFNKVLTKIKTSLKYPVIVKPSKLGSSIGISVCADENELISGISDALLYDNKVLVEECLNNIREINCAVLGNAEDYVVSELEEPIKQDEILSFSNKYLNSTASKNSMENLKRKMPADLDEKIRTQIIKTSEKVFTDLNLSGVVRFDYILCNDMLYLNELNTIPGSLAFYLFKPKNIAYADLLNKLINNAIKENKNSKKLITTFNSSILKGVTLPNKLGGNKL